MMPVTPRKLIAAGITMFQLYCLLEQLERNVVSAQTDTANRALDAEDCEPPKQWLCGDDSSSCGCEDPYSESEYRVGMSGYTALAALAVGAGYAAGQCLMPVRTDAERKWTRAIGISTGAAITGAVSWAIYQPLYDSMESSSKVDYTCGNVNDDGYLPECIKNVTTEYTALALLWTATGILLVTTPACERLALEAMRHWFPPAQNADDYHVLVENGPAAVQRPDAASAIVNQRGYAPGNGTIVAMEVDSKLSSDITLASVV